MSHSADSYAEEADKNYEKQAFHLDGYLYAQKLSQLAMLEKRAIKEETLDMTNGFTTSELAPVMDDKSDWNAQIKVVDPISVTKIEPGSPVSRPEPTTPDNSSNDDDDTTPSNNSRDDGGSTPTVVHTRTSDRGSENVALTETAQILEREVPLTEALMLPAREVPSTDAIEILEGAVPLAGGVTISDEDVPLANVPRTGDISAIWYAVAMMCACGLCALFTRKEDVG